MKHVNHTEQSYIVATVKSWNIEGFKKYTPSFKGNWHLINNRDDFTLENIKTINPRYIFFPHWSWIVPKEIIQSYECVCFHMTDVPYGRGGSPLQNLIIRGHKETKLTALKMIEEIDAGPVYTKEKLSLTGSAEQILKRSSDISYKLIQYIISKNPIPNEQEGDVVEFVRRTPNMSILPEEGGVEDIYNHIRMLDAEGYPHAFIEYGEYTMHFSEAQLIDNELKCSIVIKRREG